jgi:hypothetical protein
MLRELKLELISLQEQEVNLDFIFFGKLYLHP